MLQFSIALRNAILDAIETTIGTAPVIKLFDIGGSIPANCAAADGAAVLLATFTLPSDWLANASGASKPKTGTWPTPAALATSTAQHFRLYSSGGTCHMQGTVTATGGGGDMTADSLSVTAGQILTIDPFTLAAGNA